MVLQTKCVQNQVEVVMFKVSITPFGEQISLDFTLKAAGLIPVSVVCQI